MHVFTLALSAILVLVLAMSALSDLVARDVAGHQVTTLGLPVAARTQNAMVKFTIVAGLLIGRGSGPITFTAACCLLAFLFVSTFAHRRASGRFDQLVPLASLGAVAITLALFAFSSP